MKGFLATRGCRIVDEGGKTVYLKGINLGGWLLMEAYMLHAPNRGESIFKKEFQRRLGKKVLKEFEKVFREHFIRREDIQRIAHYGFNCLRVPFHYRVIEDKPYRYAQEGIQYLDRVIGWAGEYGLKVILDLHAACGAQNHDWHGDSDGRALLWQKESYRHRTYALWEFLSDRYRNNTTVVGYDILNEAVTKKIRLLNDFYRQVIKAIRKNDKNHIIFIEGNNWAMDLDIIEEIPDTNSCLSIHAYQPLDFVMNFIPHLHYPLKAKGWRWDKTVSRKLLMKYYRFSQKRQMPVFVGEFGVNNRDGLYGEHLWVRDMIDLFREFGFHWTYWTYKSVKNNAFPDGLLSYFGNPPWVNRQGPQMGWETYAALWLKNKKNIIYSWHSENFEENKAVLRILQKAVS